MKKNIFLLIAILAALVICSIYAEADNHYYADIEMDISSNGDVRFSGISNHPAFSDRITSNYTIKEKSHWIVNFTIPDQFSDYVVKITFPKDAVINYLKIPNINTIEEQDGRVIITSLGSNNNFYLVSQYRISRLKNVNYLGVGVLMVAFIITFIIIFFFIKRQKKTMKNIDYKGLTERQKQIIKIMVKNKGETTQYIIQKNLDLPKASISRNIDSLVRKGIIEKHQKGKTNLLSLKNRGS